MAAGCNNTATQSQRDVILIVMSSVGTVSFIFCVLTTKLAFFLKLHKHFIYRLPLYQVVSSMLISVNDFLVITLTSYVFKQHHSFHHVMCLLTGFLLTYFIWMKLLFTTILIFHLFSLAVCLKDFKRFEIHYVLFSILFPLTFTWIPFINHNYGPAGGWCWIKDYNDDCTHNKEGIIEQYVLFYGPWYLCLVFGVIAASAVLFVLVRKGCLRNDTESESEPLLRQNNQQHKKALMEVSPLLTYPLIFFLFNIFAMTHRIYNAISEYPNFALTLMHSFVNAIWGTLSSIALLIHLSLTHCTTNKGRVKSQSSNDPNHRSLQPGHVGEDRFGLYSSFTEIPKTYFTAERESEVDEYTRNEEDSS